jgi:hypothetical protein
LSTRRVESPAQRLALLLLRCLSQEIVRRQNNETVHIACYEMTVQLFEFCEIRIRVRHDMRTNQKTRQFRRANPIDGLAKCSLAPRSPVVPLLESLELYGEEKPRDWAKLMNAAPETSAVDMNKYVSACVHDSARKAADFRVQQWLTTANPNHRAGTPPHRVQAHI